MTKTLWAPLFTLALVACTDSSAGDPTDPDDPNDPSDPDDPSATCDSFLPELTEGTEVMFSSSSAGNPLRAYCFMLPTGSTQIRIELRGGQCAIGDCIGDDVRMFLKRGAVPDPSEDDEDTTEFSYTPAEGGFGTFGKSGEPGPWYLGIRDDANTLGYGDVTMWVEFP